MLCAARDLSPPGELTSQQLLPFEFNSVEMEHDSYRGLQVRLRWGGVVPLPLCNLKKRVN